MTTADIDWSYLRQGVVLRFALCALAVAAFAASAWARTHYAAESDVEQQQLAALDQQRSELASRLKARQAYAARYVELEEAGVVGEEQRLEWAQTLRDSATALRLPYLRYSASPQQPFEAPWLVPGTAAPVRATTMELQAGLVHEGDLLRLIARLRDEAPGYFDVTGCTLERTGGDTPPEPDKANITGTCQLRWYSIPVGGEPGA